MPAKRSALAALDAAIADAPRHAPKRSWFSRLPKEAQQDFAEIKKRYDAGEYAGVEFVVIHRAVAARCKEESWPAPADPGTVRRWLLR
jgi:hypothetical protein